MKLFEGENKAVSPVIGVVLMVAITVALAAVAGLVVLSSGDQLHDGSANAKVEFQSTSTWLVLKVEHISTDADVQINEKTITTLSEGDAGKKISLPSAPGDKIVITSGGRESSVLVSKTVDKSESADFITYYRMDDDSGSSTAKDYSGNDNHGTVGSEVSFTGDAAEFTSKSSSNNDITVSSLDTSKKVDEMTIAVDYKHTSSQSYWDSTGDIDLVEHDDGTNTLSLLTRNGGTNGKHTAFGEYPGAGRIESSAKFANDERHVIIATFDGSDFVLYADGEEIGSKPSGKDFSLGSLTLGKDPGYTGDNFIGKIYDFRMYYEAFDEGEVDTLFNAMGS